MTEDEQRASRPSGRKPKAGGRRSTTSGRKAKPKGPKLSTRALAGIGVGWLLLFVALPGGGAWFVAQQRLAAGQEKAKAKAEPTAEQLEQAVAPERHRQAELEKKIQAWKDETQAFQAELARSKRAGDRRQELQAFLDRRDREFFGHFPRKGQ